MLPSISSSWMVSPCALKRTLMEQWHAIFSLSHCFSEPFLCCSGSQLVGSDPSTGVEYQISCISDIYNMILNSSKITVMKQEQNNLLLGSSQHVGLCWRVAVLGRLRTRLLKLPDLQRLLNLGMNQTQLWGCQIFKCSSPSETWFQGKRLTRVHFKLVLPQQHIFLLQSNSLGSMPEPWA